MNRRDARVLSTFSASLLSKGLGAILQLASVPIALGYLGSGRFGLLSVIVSSLPLVAVAGLGLGNTVVNAVAAADAKGDESGARRSIANAMCVLGVIALGGTMVIVLTAPWIPWNRVMKCSECVTVAELKSAWIIGVAAGLFSLPLMVGARAQLGYQEGAANGAWDAVGKILGFLLLIVGVSLELTFVWIVAVTLATYVLSPTLCSAYFFLRSRPTVVPRLRDVSLSGTKELLKDGMLFTLLEVGVSVSLYTDSIIVWQMISAEAAAIYTILMRLLSVPTTMVWLILSPLWPAYRQAMLRGDAQWVRRTVVRSVIVGGTVSVGIGIAFTVLGDVVMSRWVGGQVQPSRLMLVGGGLWLVVYTVVANITSLLWAANELRRQAICGLSMAVVGVPLKVAMCRMWGIDGVIFSTSLYFTLFMIVPLVPVAWRAVRRVGGTLQAMPAGADA